MEPFNDDGEEGEEGGEEGAGGEDVVEIDRPDDLEEGQAVAMEDRITTPYMTKYERARILGTRALQIRCAARRVPSTPCAPSRWLIVSSLAARLPA